MRPLRGPPNRINGSDPGSVTDAAVAGISSEIVRTVDRLVKARTPPEMRNHLNRLLRYRYATQSRKLYLSNGKTQTLQGAGRTRYGQRCIAGVPQVSEEIQMESRSGRIDGHIRL